MNRIIGTLLAVVWVIAMAAIVRRDVLPFWQAEEAPHQILSRGDYQIGIHNDAGVRIGSTWITAVPTPHVTAIHSTTVLDLRRVANILPWAGRLILETDLSYSADGTLDEFIFMLDGAGMPIKISGERGGSDYACLARLGDKTTTLLLDGRLSQYIGDSMRPFTHLDRLRVGQSWRMRLLDPFALLKGDSVEFVTELATVTRRERIHHLERVVDCFRIETTGATAWADDAGRVLRQEVTLPLLGKWVLVDEPFNDAERRAAVRAPSKPVPGHRHRPARRRVD